jgi:acetyl esterase/lipase
MLHKKYTIAAGTANAFAYTYILDNTNEVDGGKRVRPLVIICPGGGYAFTSDTEAEPIAIQMNALGFHAVVLRYSVAPAKYPSALLQVAKTVALAREHATEWHVDPKKIIVAGFSAGGHLAASIGVLWNKGLLEKELGQSGETFRPDGLLLAYPVISSGVFAHKGSIKNLYGDNPLHAAPSLEDMVDADTPPAFLWHTTEDKDVPMENTLLFVGALRKYNVPFELHVYQYGGHGLPPETTEPGKAKAYANTPGWIALAGEWIKALK